MRRHARIDENQPDIVKTLRKIPGFSVAITSDLGNGFGDIVCGFLGVNGIYEIKDPAQEPARRKLTDKEADFHKAWHGHIRIAETAAEIAIDMRAMANRRAA